MIWLVVSLEEDGLQRAAGNRCKEDPGLSASAGRDGGSFDWALSR